MSSDYERYLELQKSILAAEKKRLGFVRDTEVQVRKKPLKGCKSFETIVLPLVITVHKGRLLSFEDERGARDLLSSKSGAFFVSILAECESFL